MFLEKPIVVNLIGGPGCGKSTNAAGVFYELKVRGVSCEMALEFAKDKVWEEAFRTMDDQIYMFAKQFHKLWRLRGKVDVIVTDSPLLLSSYYMKEGSEFFDSMIKEQFDRFDNMVYFLERPDGYREEGRLQTLEESKAIDAAIKDILSKSGVGYKSLPAAGAKDAIVDDVLGRLAGPA